jgi:hypothetical protein
MTDADSDSDPVWQQNNADPLADPAPSFTLNGKSEFVLLAIFFIFLIIGKCFRISIFWPAN